MFATVLLLLFIAAGSAFVSFFVLRARTEAALARERAQLAEVRAEARTTDHLMTQRVRATEQETRQKALDELMRDLRFEQCQYSGESDAVGGDSEIMLPIKRVFFRNLCLFSWVDHDAVAADHETHRFGSMIRYQPASGVPAIVPREAEEPAVSQYIERTATASASRVLFAGAVEESHIDFDKEGSQMFRLKPLSERTSANASFEDKRVIPDPIESPIPEPNGIESNSNVSQTVVSAAEELYYKSTFKLTTTAGEANNSSTETYKEGIQMYTQTPARPLEDQRLTRQLTSTLTSWNAKEAAQEAIPAALASVDEIYHKSNFKPTTTTAEWHILKVADMLNSDHLRGLSAAAKHSALLMALEAAGVSVEDVLQDAVQRQRVLNEYEQAQQARLQQLEAIKLRESERLTAEMETIRSQYEARIAEVVNGLEQERDSVREWQANKEIEQRRIAEAASCVSYASNENNVKYLVEKNANAQRMRETA
jgi:hypothetical protein